PARRDPRRLGRRAVHAAQAAERGVCRVRQENALHGRVGRGLQGSNADAGCQQEGKMKQLLCLCAFGVFLSAGIAAQRGGEAPPAAAPTGPGYPAWAYAITPPPPPGAPRPPAPAEDTTTVHHIPGTTRAFTVAQIADIRGPADWFPEDHPVMPSIVAVGRQPMVRSVSYILQTLDDFKNGLRKPGDPRKVNVNQMIAFAKNMTPEEMRDAAEYFASVPW